MARRKPGTARRGKPAAAQIAVSAIVVAEDERKRLIEDCAFFRAARFRPAMPGDFREQDLGAAASAIDAVIKPRRRRPRGR